MHFNELSTRRQHSLRAALYGLLLAAGTYGQAQAQSGGGDRTSAWQGETITVVAEWTEPVYPEYYDPTGFYDDVPNNDVSGGGDALSGDPVLDHAQVCAWIRERKPQNCATDVTRPQDGFFPSLTTYANYSPSALERIYMYTFTTPNAARYDAVMSALADHTTLIASGWRLIDANLQLFNELAYVCNAEHEGTLGLFGDGQSSTTADWHCREALEALLAESTGSGESWWSLANRLLGQDGVSVTGSHSFGPIEFNWSPPSPGANSTLLQQQAITAAMQCAVYNEDMQRNGCN